MTVLTSESTLLGTGARLPRVNLLPPEIAEQKKARRIQAGLGVALASSVVLVGGLWFMASQSVSSAQEELAAAQSTRTALQADVARFSQVTSIINATQAAEAQVYTAMGDEVRYSQLLNDLSLAIPSTVWLKTLAYAPATAAPAPGAAGAPVAAGAPGAPGATAALATQIGTFNVTGQGYEHDDVALWLDAIGRLTKSYDDPYFSTSTKSPLGEKTIVNFTATAKVQSTARSGRYKPAGG